MVKEIFNGATDNEIIEIEQILLIVNNPYEILKCNIKSNIIEINSNYNELLNLDESNQNYINQLNNAYNLLSNERLREVYNEMYYSNNYFKRYIFYVSLYINSTVFNKLTQNIISPLSNGNLVKAALDIYSEKGITGFYNRFAAQVIIGFLKSRIKLSFLGNNNNIFRSLLVIYLRYSLDYIFCLITIAPLSTLPLQIIDMFILKRIVFIHPFISNLYSSDNSPLALNSSLYINNIKNILISIAYGSMVWYSLIKLESLYFKFKNNLKQLSSTQSDSKLIYISNLIFNNFYISSAVQSLIRFPFLILNSQYPSMLVSTPSIISPTLNPVSMAIKLFIQNRVDTFSRITNAFLPDFIETLIYNKIDHKKYK